MVIDAMDGTIDQQVDKVFETVVQMSYARQQVSIGCKISKGRHAW
jgi:hypothetical protein